MCIVAGLSSESVKLILSNLEIIKWKRFLKNELKFVSDVIAQKVLEIINMVFYDINELEMMEVKFSSEDEDSLDRSSEDSCDSNLFLF